MARFSFTLFLFVASLLFGGDLQTETADTNTTQIEPKKDKPVVVEDKSGLSKEELSKKAKEFDKEKKRLEIKDIVESIDENGKVNVTKLIKEKSFSPEPKDGYDWIRTKYGDWLIGHVRSLYEKTLEFDSKEFGIYLFKFKDIVEITRSGERNKEVGR